MPIEPAAKNTRQVTSKQLAILKTLYTFRFGTTDLLAKALDLKDGRYIHTRLEALVKQEYIGKNYDSTYKLDGKPATYHLLPKAFKVLKQQKGISLRALRNTYKDAAASKQFIARNIAIFTIYDRLRAIHTKQLQFFSKSNLNFDKFDYFPKPPPDAFLRFTPEGIRPRNRSYFLNYLDEDTPFFVHVRRLQKYIDYIENDEWENTTNTKLRAVLLVCESTVLLKRIRKKLAQAVDDDETPRFCYTTLQALKKSSPEDDEIWQMIGRPLELFGLKDI